jgi:hypothetical protein
MKTSKRNRPVPASSLALAFVWGIIQTGPTEERLMRYFSLKWLMRWALVGVSVLPLVLLVVARRQGIAMPNFARKYNVDCSTCHTTIPRLNQTGYKFRAAGFRMPEEIGKVQDRKFELGDYFAGRMQPRYDIQVTNQPNGAPAPNLLPSGAPGPRTMTNSFNFMEFTVYPLTGSWGKYLGSLAELSFSPEDFMEVENAYVRFVYGNEKRFFTARAGIFHSWEGFGASDRPYSNARTLFQTSPISSKGTAIPYLFQPWGLDEAGIEVGGDINKLSLRAALLGGNIMRWDEDAQTFLAFPAQTGPWKGANQAVSALSKRATSAAHSTPDFSTNVTYLLHPNGGGATFLYYHGNMSTPTACFDGTKIGKIDPSTSTVCGGANTDFTTRSTQFRNNFDRVALFGSYPVGSHFLPMAGFQWGQDTNPDLTKFDSKGWFGEGAFPINDYVTAGVRYDWFHPKVAALNSQWAVTPYVNVALLNGFQVIAEYQHRDFQLDAVNHRNNDTIQMRVIFIK